MSIWKDVREFQAAMELPMAERPTLDLGPEMLKLRRGFLLEELQELDDAIAAGDVLEFADALVDLIYFAVGFGWTYGINLEPIWDAVQKANMAKLVDGKVVRREDGKVLKPEGWVGPQEDERAILQRQGWVP